MIDENQLEKLSLQIADNNTSLLGYWDRDYVCRYANKAYTEWFGLAPDKIINKLTLQDLLTPAQFEKNTIYFEQVFKGSKQAFEQTLTIPNGETRNASVILTPHIGNDVIKGFFCQVTDITKLKKLENSDKDIQKSKRIYEFISKTNDLILHAKNEEQIFSEICNIAVNSGNFLFSWIGIADEVTKNIKPRNWAGHENGYLSIIKSISIADIPEGRGPSGKAYREGKFYYSNNITTDPAMAIWRDEAVKRGFHSTISLPIKVDEKGVAVFNIYASTPLFFTEEEIQLLVRVTDNISYALNTFNIDKKRRDAEKQLQKVTQAVEQSSASVVITDLNGDIEYVNPAFTKLTGYSLEEALGQNPRILKTGYTSASEYKNIWNDITHFKEWRGEFYNKKKNGETYWEKVSMSPVINGKGEITSFIAVKEDITERKKLEEEQKKLLTLIENSVAFIAISDLKRNFLYGNKAIREVLEIGDDDITKYNFVNFRSDRSEEIEDEVEKTLLGTGKWTGESIYTSKSGKETPVMQIYILHNNDQGEMTHVSATAIDLTNVKEAEKELLRVNNELRDFSRHLQQISEIEKNKLALEMHDELGQGLVSLKLEVYQIKTHLHDDKAIIEKKIDDLLVSINEKVEAFSKIYHSVNPTMLKDLGLFSAVENLVLAFKKSNAISIKFISDIENDPIPYTTSLALYRIVQESLSNIIYHSGAKNCSVSLMKRTGLLLLNIKDDGCGFDILKIDTKFSHGILGMRERAYAINGKFNINSALAEGTVIEIEVPI